MTNSGKTTFLLEERYKGVFEYIFLVCPTYFINKTYQEWKYKNNETFLPICCDHDEVSAWLKYISNLSEFGDRVLLILDDCASGKDLKNKNG